jgi:hypothetical protein
MAVYERGSGGHVAERVRPQPGSEGEAQLAALAADPASPWRRADQDPPAGSGVGSGGPDVGQRPARSAPKGAWVAYAVSLGADEDAADHMTKDQLIERYGKDGA